MKFETFKELEDKLSMPEKSSLIVTFLNPFSYNIYRNKCELFSEFSLCADGTLLVKYYNLLYKGCINRVSFDFSSIAPVVLRHCEVKQKKVAFIGGAREQIDSAMFNIKKMYPALDVCYSSHGYISGAEQVIINELKVCKPDIIIVGMGTPLQEEFLLACKKNLDFEFGFTCGGFISQTAVRADFYHPIVKKLGLRWLQRAYESQHVRKRLVRDYPKFLFLFLYDRLVNKYAK